MTEEKPQRRTLSVRPSARTAGFEASDHTTEIAPSVPTPRRGMYTGDLDSLDYRDVYSLRLASINGAYFRSDHGHFDEAEQMLRDNIVRLDREIKCQLTAIAKICAKAGEFDRAEETLFEALDVDDQDSRTLMALGNLYKQMGRYDDALQRYGESLEIDPDDKFTHFDMGLTYLALGQREQAASCFYEVIDIDPEDRKAHEELSQLAAQGVFPHPSNGG